MPRLYRLRRPLILTFQTNTLLRLLWKQIGILLRLKSVSFKVIVSLTSRSGFQNTNAEITASSVNHILHTYTILLMRPYSAILVILITFYFPIMVPLDNPTICRNSQSSCPRRHRYKFAYTTAWHNVRLEGCVSHVFAGASILLVTATITIKHWWYQLDSNIPLTSNIHQRRFLENPLQWHPVPTPNL